MSKFIIVSKYQGDGRFKFKGEVLGQKVSGVTMTDLPEDMVIGQEYLINAELVALVPNCIPDSPVDMLAKCRKIKPMGKT